MTHIAIYPGTFDPITYGHRDIIKKALGVVDKLVIGVAVDTVKTPIFSLEQRLQMVQDVIDDMSVEEDRLECFGFEGLVVNFAKEHQATILIRGLRAVSDFEYEFQMSGMNSKLMPDVQTIFLPASENTHFIASRFVKEIVRLGGDVKGLVSDSVRNKLIEYYNK